MSPQRKNNHGSREYRITAQEHLLRSHYLLGKKLAKTGNLGKAINEFHKAIELDKSVKSDLKVLTPARLSKIRRKLSLALNEYATRLIAKPKLNKKEFDEAMQNFDSAIYTLEQIPDVEKTNEDKTRLDLIKSNKDKAYANLSGKFVISQAHEQDYASNLKPLQRPTPSAPQPGRPTPQGPESNSSSTKQKMSAEAKLDMFSTFKQNKKEAKSEKSAPAKSGPKRN